MTPTTARWLVVLVTLYAEGVILLVLWARHQSRERLIRRCGGRR